MSIPTVTFDSNIWEYIVDDSKRTNKKEYEKLYTLIV